MDLNYQEFANGGRNLLIAPAGYGKTHTIVECLKYTQGKQLILTHTHAGVSAIKSKIRKVKIRKEKISSSKFHIETISSFAQKYVHAFYMGNDMPNQDDNKNYFPFIIKEAIELFKLNQIKNTIELSYDGLFVDEYQDCNQNQHEMIMCLAEILPIRILGDPLQGIFDFNGDGLVDFDEDLNDFEKYELETPHRWHKHQKHELAEALKTMREALENKKCINLNNFKKIKDLHILKVDNTDITKKESAYRQWLDKLILNPENTSALNSLLIITPNTDTSSIIYKKQEKKDDDFKKDNDINIRKSIRAIIDPQKRLKLIEAIDEKKLYSLAKKIDDCITKIIRARKHYKKIKNEILEQLFNKGEYSKKKKSSLRKWFNDNSIDNNKLRIQENNTDTQKSEVLRKSLDSFISNPSPETMLNIIKIVKDKLKCKYGREELLNGIIKALDVASSEKISVYEGMKKHRNIVRRVGRKVDGKCLGTTLLTKGLEFDTVVILNAEKFDCPKHLYVALTRCCKKLVIFTENMTLSPYKK